MYWVGPHPVTVYIILRVISRGYTCNIYIHTYIHIYILILLRHISNVCRKIACLALLCFAGFGPLLCPVERSR